MIVKMKYDDVKGNTLKVVVDDKKVVAYMRVAVTADNIVEALEKYKNAKNIVAFDYVGDMQTLEGLNLGSTPVCVKYTLEDVDSTVDDIMASVPKGIRVIINLPEKFCNMKVIEEYSSKYANIRFCGGHFLRLEGCNLGCVGVQDVPKKVHSNRIKLNCKGCACVYENVDINDFDIVEFTDEIIPVKESVMRTPKTKSTTPKSAPKKKAVPSIIALAREKGVVEF